jgi:hypothetical protein
VKRFAMIAPIDPEYAKLLQEKGVWKPECPVHLSDLVIVYVHYINFDGKHEDGRLVVHRALGEQTERIFEGLLKLKFPIHSIIPVEAFDGDDERTMEANNSSAFNYRRIMDSDKFSSHAYGVAIDINPRQNPYLLIDHDKNQLKLFPTNSFQFLNRAIQQPGMVESIISIFAKYGFTNWGGHWNSHCLDYHHFQVSEKDFEFLKNNPVDEVVGYFERHYPAK